MNENINLVEILKDAPKGTKLWSPVCGDCEFVEIDEDAILPIICFVLEGRCHWGFREDGSLTIYKSAECVLFPSEENRDWSTFKVPQKHKHFEAFQKVLYKSYNNLNKELIWTADFYSHYCNRDDMHYTIASYCGIDDADIIPFEGNEDKIGKSVE